MKIVIVDYGMGNIPSIVSAIKHVGNNNVLVSDSAKELESADRILLPGVGNFSQAMKIIQDKGLDDILSELVLVKKKPILGICLGMQLLGKSSTESGFNEGLGFIDGKVEVFVNSKIKVPHVGYNQISINNNSRLYQTIKPNPDYYFTHSFKMTTEADIGQSLCNYSEDFVASFEVENIAGTQFHPELSQHNGLKLLNNFIENF
jgi:glutamine amidotransferase